MVKSGWSYVLHFLINFNNIHDIVYLIIDIFMISRLILIHDDSVLP